MTNTTDKPHCQCLYEIENNLPRTKRCLVACKAQFEILMDRQNQAISKSIVEIDNLLKDNIDNLSKDNNG